MKKTYIIQWKSTVNGRAGKGKKLFDRQEAEKLVEELNLEYPQIHHEIMDTSSEGDAEQPSNAPIVLFAAS